MPIHTYTCPECCAVVERIVTHDERDNQFCEVHAVLMSRSGVEAGASFDMGDKFTGALTSTGQRIRGKFES